MGSAERRLEKPECISPQIERQRARAARSSGSSPAFGFNSFRYSPIASVSHILTLPCLSEGTRNEGERRSNSARVDGSSIGAVSSAKSSPAMRHSNQPRRHQEE